MLMRWKSSLVVYVFIALLPSTNSVSLAPIERLKCTQGTVCAVNKTHLDFFLIGDTGGISFDITNNHLNLITSTRAQDRTAASMVEVSRNMDLDFIVNVGDNVYWTGVDDVMDKRFYTVFDSVYSDDRLMVPWYMIAGNHDHLGNIEAQLRYTNYSSQWTFPNLFYKVQYAFDEFKRTADFIFIDTIVLCGNTIDVDGRSILSWIKSVKLEADGPDPEYEQLAVEQWKWIEEQLKSSRADYLFVMGHYPIHSVAGHGSVKCIADRLDPLLKQYQVTAYVSGHDHALQFFKEEAPTTDPSVNPSYYIVTGAGSRTDPGESHLDKESKYLKFNWPKSTDVSWWRRTFKFGQLGFGYGGFASVRLGSDNATIKFYIRKADMVYEDVLPIRKQKI